MLTVEHEYDPEDYVSQDVGIASDQYERWANSPPVAGAAAKAQAEAEHRVSHSREVVILGAAFLALFALERILGRKFTGSKGAATGGMLTGTARAMSGA